MHYEVQIGFKDNAFRDKKKKKNPDDEYISD